MKLTYAGLIAALTVLLLTACPPKYPNCDTDEHCAEQGEYCIDKTCKECRSNEHCSAKNQCLVCGATHSCEKIPGCCTSDLDCPGGKCWFTDGGATGECGGKCKTNEHCPPGQICSGGNCVPDKECTSDAQCPAGKVCEDNMCVVACQPEAVYFDYNEYVLTYSAQSTLDKNADCIKKRGQSVTIEGHCDERGTDEYNLALGTRRANSAKKYLKNLGVTGLSSTSYGEEKPTCSESNESCWSQNRRCEFVF